MGVYGFLIKIVIDEKGGTHLFLQAMRDYKLLAIMGVVAFALCAASALFQGFLSTKCLSHQLIISRYFGRLEGNRWNEADKESFRNTIKENQVAQKRVLKWGGWLLFTATIALIFGAVLIGLCSGLVLLNG